MNVPHNGHRGHDEPPSFWSSRYAIGLVVIGGIAAYFLLTEHFAHLVGALPYLLLLACPLMHIFMHGGHGVHSHHQERDAEKQARDDEPRKPAESS